MSQIIARLMERNAIHIDTELSVKMGKELHRVLVLSPVYNTVNPKLACASVVDGQRVLVNMADIRLVDGMTVERIAKLYNVNLDGTAKPIPSKRGRKPKNVSKA